MRSIHVMASSEVGGGARYLELILPEMLRVGIHAEVITSPGGPLVENLRSNGVKVHTPLDMMARRFSPLQSLRLRRFISQLKPSLVHFHGTRAAFQGTLLGLSFPSIYTSHGAATLQQQSWQRRKLMAWVERHNARRVSRFTGVSVRDVMSITGTTDPQAYVPNPVDPRFIRTPASVPRKTRGVSRDAPLVIGTVARLVPQKGLETLLDAAEILAQSHSVRVLLVGDGPLRESLERRAHRHGLNVNFVGTVSDPRPYLERMNVFVMASRWEGQPLSVLEAVAYGIPVVASLCPGLRELASELGIRHCANVDDPADFAAKIRELEAMNNDDFQSYLSDLYSKILKRHPSETVGAWLHHYRDVVSCQR